MTEVLDDGLELVISEEIDGISGWVKSFLKVRFEWVHNQANLQVGIWCEYFGRVDFSELEWPVVNDDNFVVEINDVNVGELLMEFSYSLLGEVSCDKEVAIGDEEMRVWFFNVALEGLLQILGDFVEVTSLVEHFCEKLFESTLLLSLTFAHGLIRFVCEENLFV